MSPSGSGGSTGTGRVLVTGATGYVGGRLVPLLLEKGHRVRAVSRSTRKLRDRAWADHPQIDLAEADALDPGSLEAACQGCSAAYYLIHSMGSSGKDFEDRDRRAARNMVRAAESTGLDRLIYLGGLGDPDRGLSKHLRSRAEVAEVLRQGSVPVTVLRAAVIIGSGSASFEVLRYLVERLPVMTTPTWVRTRSQPIAIRNVLGYLVGCLEHPETAGETYDIGGPDVVTYEELMRVYAREAGLPDRWIVPLPFLSPWLSSLWLHLVTPVPAGVARPLIEGLRHPAVCEDDRIREVIPQDLLGVREAVGRALGRTRRGEVSTHWTDAGSPGAVEGVLAGDPEWAGGDRFVEHFAVEVDVAPDELWAVLEGLGGESGYHFANWLWWLRGLIDRLLGGVGLQRGRRDAGDLRAGDALDFWRVDALERPRLLRLVAEMKLPGEAVLEFTVRETARGTRCDQVARFVPRGLAGLCYWYLVKPFHAFLFRGMLREIARRAGGDLIEGPYGVDAREEAD